jgi:hypothetical protein
MSSSNAILAFIAVIGSKSVNESMVGVYIQPDWGSARKGTPLN